MFETFAALGVAVLGGTLSAFLPGLDEADDLEEAGPEAAAAADPADAPRLPVISAEEPWFENFDPMVDQVVVVFPDSMGSASLSDLSLAYDEEHDETEVTLKTPEGERCVCFLPEVAPGEMDAANFDFMSESEARAQLGL